MQIKNLPYIITYILAAVLVFLGTLFYRQPLLIILLLLMLLLPIISIATTRYAYTRLEVQPSLPAGQIQLPHELVVKLRFKNPTIVPLLNCELHFHYENLYLPNKVQQVIVLPAEARRTNTYRLPFETKAAGMFTFEISKLLVTDFLHFYSFTLPCHWKGQLPILPAECELPKLQLTKAAIETEDSQPSPDGELTNDLLQLREYHPGDRMKDIHWKMTAKTDELMVKEYDRARDLYYLILPELDRDSLQDTLSVFYSLGLQLLKRKELFRVALYRPGAGSFEIRKISSEEELLIALYELYLIKPEIRSAAFHHFTEQYPDMYGVIRIAGGKVVPPATIESY